MRSIRDCSVAVTGGAGFLGSHLCNHLINDRNCQVLVIDNLVAGRREFINPKAKFVHADITDSEEFLYKLFKYNNVKYVFGYSAYPYIPDSFVRPLHVFNVNAFGALKVINAAHAAGCEGILQVSSAEIYGNYEYNSQVDGSNNITEEGVVCPHSTYGASKAAIDAMVQVRWKEAKTPVIALRQFNCVGERETHPYIVPEIINQLFRSTEEYKNYDGIRSRVVRLGNDSTRDFMYAGDTAAMAVELLEKGKFGQVYNLGSESSIKMYDLAKLLGIITKLGPVTVVEEAARVRPWEIWHLQSNNTKIYSTIDYRPKVSLEEALELTIDYYLDNGKKWCWE